MYLKAVKNIHYTHVYINDDRGVNYNLIELL